MKTLDDIKNEVAREFGFKDFNEAKKKAYLSKDLVLGLDKVCLSYAEEVARRSLNNASKNVKIMRGSESFIFGIDLNSITDPSNIQL